MQLAKYRDVYRRVCVIHFDQNSSKQQQKKKKHRLKTTPQKQNQENIQDDDVLMGACQDQCCSIWTHKHTTTFPGGHSKSSSLSHAKTTVGGQVPNGHN